MIARVAVVIAAAVLSAAFGTASAVADAHECGPFGNSCGASGQPEVLSDEYVYAWDGAALRRGRPSSGHQVRDAGSRRVYEFAYSPMCWANEPPDESGSFDTRTSDCVATRSSALCPPAEFAMWSFRRLVGPARLLTRAVALDPAAGEWTRQGVTCVGAAEEWSLDELTAAAREYLEERVSRPDVVTEPPNGGIVSLPVIVHTEPADPVSFAVTRPVPGRLAAAPSYVWDFGEPGSPRGQGPGRGFDGTSPTLRPEHYVAHPYDTPGTKQVTLTMTWTATFSVAGLQVPLQPIVFTDVEQVTVRSARTVLVDGP